MTLLVAGADRVDAGKTTFSVGLVERLDAVGFKPRAGNDHWFDHDDYRRAVEAGRLYGKDARRLAAATSQDLAPETINPVHRLWRPTPGAGAGILGQEDRAFVVDRVGAGERATFVTNATVDLPPEVRKRLPLADAIAVDSLEAFNETMERHHLAALDEVRERIAATDRAVVESYGDVARPLRGLEVETVAVVEPGRARIYDGDRFLKACEVASGSPHTGQLEERTERVVGFVDPLASVPLPALTKDRQSDPRAVARAYEPAYDALVDAAR